MYSLLAATSLRLYPVHHPRFPHLVQNHIRLSAPPCTQFPSALPVSPVPTLVLLAAVALPWPFCHTAVYAEQLSHSSFASLYYRLRKVSVGDFPPTHLACDEIAGGPPLVLCPQGAADVYQTQEKREHTLLSYVLCCYKRVLAQANGSAKPFPVSEACSTKSG